MWVLCGSVGSCVSVCLTMLNEGSTGTEVNKAWTSYVYNCLNMYMC